MIPDTIIAEVNTPGQAVAFGSTNPKLQPKIGRALAVKTGADGKSISFIAPRAIFELHKDNLEKNKEISLNVTYPYTHKSYQFKGKLEGFESAAPDDHEITNLNVNAFHQILVQYYGEDPAKQFLKYHVKDLVHVRMNVNEIFDQTPGPEAGKKVFPN